MGGLNFGDVMYVLWVFISKFVNVDFVWVMVIGVDIEC